MSGRSAPLPRLSRQVGPSALEGFEDEGLVRLDDPSQHPGLVGSGRAEKPMPPAEGRRWVNAAEFGGLRQALALDHRSGVIEPFLFLAQMRHGRLGQGVERAPAALAAEPQKSMRASPADDLAARAMRAASALDALMAGGSKRILAMAAPSAILPRSLRQISRPGARLRAARLRQRLQRLTPLVPAQARNRRQPSRKVLTPQKSC